MQQQHRAVGRRTSNNPYHESKYQQPVPPKRERPQELTLTPKSALELWHERLHEQHHHIPLLPSAPSWLQLQPGHIYELSGPAGSGKTQLALQCCINLARRQRQRQQPATIHYLSLSGSRATVASLGYRLGQMCANHTNHNDPSSILHRIQLMAIHNEDDLRTVLLGKEHVSSCPSLLVVDSIADLFRTRDMTGGTSDNNSTVSAYAHRARTLFALAQSMRRRERTVTLILNQITARIDGAALQEQQPALGLAWSHCVSSRWRVVRREQQQQRYIEVVHDPRVARRTAQFVVETGGCRWVDDDDDTEPANT